MDVNDSPNVSIILPELVLLSLLHKLKCAKKDDDNDDLYYQTYSRCTN